MRPVLVVVATFALLGVVFFGCSSDSPMQSSVSQSALEMNTVEPTIGEGTFNLKAKYNYVKTYPGGGGIFVLRMIPNADLVGDVALSLKANKNLAATLSTSVVSDGSNVFEVTISPTDMVQLTTYIMTVTARNQTHTETIELQVELVDWGVSNVGIAQEKQDQFIEWLEAEHPELGTFDNQLWDLYGTYPQILIVEHYTFLSQNWEFRVCFHVMIPPYDWSMMLLRARGEWNADLAAIREWDEASGTYVIHEILIKDYPIMDVY